MSGLLAPDTTCRTMRMQLVSWTARPVRVWLGDSKTQYQIGKLQGLAGLCLTESITVADATCITRRYVWMHRQAHMAMLDGLRLWMVAGALWIRAT